MLSPYKVIRGALITAIILHVLLILILSSVPPVSRDALTHHLAVPKLYIEKGKIYEIPHIPFSYYPMNLDLLYIVPLLLKKDYAAKYIHFIFAIMTAYYIFSFLKNRVGENYALLGGLFFLTLPAIVKLSITVYVDLGLVFFSTAALINIIKWNNNQFKAKYLVASAVFSGLAMGTKYNGLVVFLVLTLLLVILRLRRKTSEQNCEKKALIWGGWFFIVAMVFFSPWMIKNYIWTGNPLYPLYRNVFQHYEKNKNNESKSIRLDPENWPPFKIRKVIYKENILEILSIPVRIFFEGKDDEPKRFDGKLSPFLFFFFVISLFMKTTPYLESREKYTLVGYSVSVILISFLMNDMRIRYITPALPPLFLLSMVAIKKVNDFFSEIRKKRWRLSAQAYLSVMILSAFLYNGLYLYDQFIEVKPFEYIEKKLSRDEYIQRYRSEFYCVRYANDNLFKESKILGIFIGNRSYYFDREIRFSSSFLFEDLYKFNSEEMLYNRLKNEGYSHLFIRHDLLNQWMKINFDRKSELVFNSFLKDYSKVLCMTGGFGLYQLTPQKK